MSASTLSAGVAEPAKSIAGSAALRDGGFDAWLIIGIPSVALATLVTVLLSPPTFYFVLTLDLWLLGYHHVIATYARLGLDRDNRAKHWMLILVLPVAVIAVVFAIGLVAGAGVLTTIYFYWLWFHYVRQSEGVSKAYAAKGGMREAIDRPLHRISFYLLPTTSLLQLIFAGDSTLLSIEIRTPTIPASIMVSMWSLTGLTVATSLFCLCRTASKGKSARFYLAYLCSHYLMFFATYGLIDDISVAWLGLNIWHNLQYLTFVWLSHERKYKGKVVAGSKLLSTLAIPKNIWLYVLGCLSVTFAFYMVVQEALGPIESLLGTSALLTAVMVYQTINFHHYIVDALIWRRPKPSPSHPPSDASSPL